MVLSKIVLHAVNTSLKYVNSSCQQYSPVFSVLLLFLFCIHTYNCVIVSSILPPSPTPFPLPLHSPLSSIPSPFPPPFPSLSSPALYPWQLIVVPYNTLLHAPTRKAVGISLKGNVVIIDEAHNLLDTISNIHSVQITGTQVSCPHCLSTGLMSCVVTVCMYTSMYCILYQCGGYRGDWWVKVSRGYRIAGNFGREFILEIGGFESNPPIFPSAKLNIVTYRYTWHHQYVIHRRSKCPHKTSNFKRRERK